MAEKYIHREDTHNLTSPSEIIPIVIKMLDPKSVIDIGCGVGTFLSVFKQHGITDVLGVDGKWVNRDLLKKYLAEDEFLETDLEKPFSTDKKYDLVVSLEVAEHIAASSADIFVSNIVAAGKMILFSAAIPGQGGQNHINEQWLTYWEEKFGRHGYQLHDVMRPLIWENSKIQWWYRQNMVVFAPAGFAFPPSTVYGTIKNLVHFELFTALAQNRDRLEEIGMGKGKVSTYAGYLLKSILGYENYKKVRKVFGK